MYIQESASICSKKNHRIHDDSCDFFLNIYLCLPSFVSLPQFPQRKWICDGSQPGTSRVVCWLTMLLSCLEVLGEVIGSMVIGSVGKKKTRYPLVN